LVIAQNYTDLIKIFDNLMVLAEAAWLNGMPWLELVKGVMPSRNLSRWISRSSPKTSEIFSALPTNKELTLTLFKQKTELFTKLRQGIQMGPWIWIRWTID